MRQRGGECSCVSGNDMSSRRAAVWPRPISRMWSTAPARWRRRPAKTHTSRSFHVVQDEASAAIVPGKASSPQRAWLSVRIERRSYAIQGAARGCVGRIVRGNRQAGCAQASSRPRVLIRFDEHIDGDQHGYPGSPRAAANACAWRGTWPTSARLARPDALTEAIRNLPAGIQQLGAIGSRPTDEPSNRTRCANCQPSWPAGNPRRGVRLKSVHSWTHDATSYRSHGWMLPTISGRSNSAAVGARMRSEPTISVILKV